MLTFNALAGGVIKISAENIVSYSATQKGSLITYKVDGSTKTIEVYEVPSRVKTMLYGGCYE